MMLAVFAVYAAGVAGLSLAWNYESLLAFRLLASLSLGAEWGISHTYLAERVDGARRYRFSALLQFSILGGLLAAMMTRYALPECGWRWLFAASIAPVVILSFLRWRALGGADVDSVVPAAFPGGFGEARPAKAGAVEGSSPDGPRPSRSWALQESRASTLPQASGTFSTAWHRNARPFLLCFGLASLTIASGTMNVFYARDLPQSPLYTVLFWGNVVPGMLAGAWVVRRWGVARAMAVYAAGLLGLSLVAWLGASSPGSAGLARSGLLFALGLPLLNGIPFGLMGAYFNEVFGDFRTMLSGAAYNLGRIAAGFAPVLITALGLHQGGRYFLFTAGLGLGVLGLAGFIGGGGRLRTH
jgi:hypothetical protein